MRTHFSRVKDCVLVAIQRRDAGRAEHGIFLRVPYFPELLTASAFPAKALPCSNSEIYLLFEIKFRSAS